jgi:hypothetical protein
MTDSSKSFEIWYKKMILDNIMAWSSTPDEDTKTLCELNLKRMEYKPEWYSNNNVRSLFEAWEAAQADLADTITQLREQNLQLQAENQKMRDGLEDYAEYDPTYPPKTRATNWVAHLLLSTQPTTTIAEHDDPA